MLQLLVVDPTRRLSAAQVQRHPWVAMVRHSTKNYPHWVAVPCCVVVHPSSLLASYFVAGVAAGFCCCCQGSVGATAVSLSGAQSKLKEYTGRRKLKVWGWDAFCARTSSICGLFVMGHACPRVVGLC